MIGDWIWCDFVCILVFVDSIIYRCCGLNVLFVMYWCEDLGDVLGDVGVVVFCIGD